MARLEELTTGAQVTGLAGSDQAVRVVQVEWHGSDVITLTYTGADGAPGQTLLYRSDEDRLSVQAAGRAWSFDAPGDDFLLVSEAMRIDLAWLFDPYLAVQSADVMPLPHQLEAVYSRMLPLHPLKFLLADDPGAGKTIMAGLLLRELQIRGDVMRCLIIVPGSLVEQWQEELFQKFGVRFEILTRAMVEASVTGNPFDDYPLLIARLDQLARNDDLQAKLAASDWDLVIVDEAHKMSAHWSGNELKETKRYRLGKLVRDTARHFLLMTATPHNGNEDDFQLFMALLDPDRFEGKRSNALSPTEVNDLMRRLVKENLLRFDGTRLFPERKASSVQYPLSPLEAKLYAAVTDYVREEMGRVERMKTEGEGRRGAIVGFALTTLQRRLASSPQAIAKSLQRRRERLETRLAEERTRGRGEGLRIDPTLTVDVPMVDDLDGGVDIDVDEMLDAEVEELEDEVIDQASTARTIAELEAEIASLKHLERLAQDVLHSGTDRKWEELSKILENEPEMTAADGSRRKLIIFTEHRDTLDYLVTRISRLIGDPGAVVRIHGGMNREERRATQKAFTQDKGVTVLVATDAAGEGVNLQQAHLMVNYDLPWNPNRIEQRFGRIHRIGQTEVCHLWNLVAQDTREGDVFHRLFEKIDEQRHYFGDQVFDVLGELFADVSLRNLLIQAIQYGDDPLVRLRLDAIVDTTVADRMREVIDERQVLAEQMADADIQRVRDEMDRAAARRLQPQFVRAFFRRGMARFAGAVREREPRRFEVTHVPADVRNRARAGGLLPVLRRYQRLTFDRELVTVAGKPVADYCCPGHPLLDALIDATEARYGSLLRRGSVLVDERDPGLTPHVLVYLQHEIRDGRVDRRGERMLASKQFAFVLVDAHGTPADAGWAPFLDCRPATDDERVAVADVVDAEWVRDTVERRALDEAVRTSVPRHIQEVRAHVEERVGKISDAVRQRLLPQITDWQLRAQKFKDQELAGKQPRSGMNSARAAQRADDLQARLQARLAELDAERQLEPLPPRIVGAALVIPGGLLAARRGEADEVADRARQTERIEWLAVEAVMAAERSLGHHPVEMHRNHPGYDIESRDAGGRLTFIEVKGRIEGADSVHVTKTEIGVGKNKVDQHVLALVEVAPDESTTVRYVRHAFDGVGDVEFDTYQIVLPWRPLWERGTDPQ